MNLSGFTVPSPVQRAAIPLGRLGADLVVQAKSGTGKTVTFGTVVIERVDRTSAYPQALVLAPTREVALQSRDALQKLAQALDPPALRVACFLGGLPVADDRARLAAGCHACVGTPGRVRQLLEEGSLHPEGIRTLVIDEADALMGGTFEADVLFVYSMLPERKQCMAFSATYPAAMLARLESLMRQPQHVALCSQNTAALKAVRQHFLLVDVPGGERASASDAALAKESALRGVFNRVSFHQAVVFVKSAGRGEAMARRLTDAGYPAAFTAGTLPQRRRMDVMDRMRRHNARVLVSTDLTARGIDLEHVNLVAHLDVPRDASTYAHRVGRTGRFGTAGLSVTVVTEGELRRLREMLAAADGVEVRLEPLPEIVPPDWYDYELDGDTVVNFEKLKAGGVPVEDAGAVKSRAAAAAAARGSSKGGATRGGGRLARGDSKDAATRGRSAFPSGDEDDVDAAWTEDVHAVSPNADEVPRVYVNEQREAEEATSEWRARREWASYWWWWWRDRDAEAREAAEVYGSRRVRVEARPGWPARGVRDMGDEVPWIVPPLHSSLRAGVW